MIFPTLRQMHYLIALQQHQSFSKAAEACAVTQPTLSAGIKDMEATLGHALIDRRVRALRFTPLGHDVLEDCHAILERAAQMSARAKRYDRPMSGVMRLGVIPTIAPYMLPSLLPQVQRRYPDLELQVYEAMSEALVERLERGEIDVALMAFPFDTPGMHQAPLFDEAFLLAVPEGQADQWADHHLQSSDLDPGALLLLDEGHCLSDHALSACALQLPKRRKAYSASSLATLLQMVAGGYGMTLVPEMAVEASALPGGVRAVRFGAPLPYRKIGLVWRDNSPQAEDFTMLGDLIMEV